MVCSAGRRELARRSHGPGTPVPQLENPSKFLFKGWTFRWLDIFDIFEALVVRKLQGEVCLLCMAE